MTDDQSLMELDARARAAATAVKQTIVDESIPTFDPERVPGSGAPVVRPVPVDANGAGSRPRRAGRSWLPLASIAAALILIAVAAGLVITREGEQRPTDEVRSGEVSGFQLGEVPDGAFSLAGVRVGTDVDTPVSQMAATFGPDPEGTALLVAGVDKEKQPWAVPDGGRPVDIGDREGVVVEADGRSVVYVTLSPTQHVMLLGITLDEQTLVRAAASLVPNDGGAPNVAPDGLPAGWRRLATLPSDDALSDSAPLGRTGVAVSYLATESSRSVHVITTSGDRADLYAPQVNFREVTPTVVRGRDAILGRRGGDDPAPPSLVLAWFEEPGRLVQMATSGISEAELKQLAEGLDPIDGTEVSDLEAKTDAGDFEEGNQGTTAVVKGRTPEGQRWVVRVADEGRGIDRSIGVRITQANGDSTSTGFEGTGGDGVLGAVGNERIESTRVLYGLADASVTSIRATHGDESRIIRVQPVQDAAAYGFEVPIDATVRLEALDASGKVHDAATAGADDVSTTGAATTTIVRSGPAG